MTLFFKTLPADTMLMGYFEVIGFFENLTIVKNEMGEISYINAEPGVFEIGITVDPSDVSPLSKLDAEVAEKIREMFGEV